MVGEAVREGPRGLLPDFEHGLRRAAELLPLGLGVHLVLDRRDPLGRALEECELLDLVHDGRNDLRRGRAGSDHADALAGQRDAVVPACAVKGCPRERLDALDVRQRGMVRHSRRGDHEVADVGSSVREIEVPAPVLECTSRHFLAELDAGSDLVAVGHLLEVGPDLCPGCEAVVPLGVEGEEVAVEVGRHVARDARVGVLPPRPANPVALLVDDEVLEAGVAQADRRKDARHPRPDDDEPEIRSLGVGARRQL